MNWLAENLALIMFVSMFFFIFMGYPVAFIMGGLSFAFALLGAWLLGTVPVAVVQQAEPVLMAALRHEDERVRFEALNPTFLLGVIKDTDAGKKRP